VRLPAHGIAPSQRWEVTSSIPQIRGRTSSSFVGEEPLPRPDEKGNPAIADALSRPRAEPNPQTPQHGAFLSQTIRARRSGHRAEGACVTPFNLQSRLLGIPKGDLSRTSPGGRVAPSIAAEEKRKCSRPGPRAPRRRGSPRGEGTAVT